MFVACDICCGQIALCPMFVEFSGTCSNLKFGDQDMNALYVLDHLLYGLMRPRMFSYCCQIKFTSLSLPF